MKFKDLSFFREAKIFRLKIWQTPSFLFLIMGVTTIVVMLATFQIARKFDDLIFLILSVMGVTAVVFAAGAILVKIISKIIIINNARTEFLSLVTHQLRSPLTGTKYIFELVLSEKVGPVNIEQKELLVQGSSSNDQMLLLVSDLLDMAKMAEGDSPFTYEVTDITKLIKDLYNDLTPNAQAKNISLKLHLPNKALPKAKIDAKKMRFVLQNLIDNAVKYTPERGIVTISATTKDKAIQVDVKDTGIGIPKDEQEKMFTKFYRASNAEKSKKTGTGLGLYIIKNIVQRHGGEIWFKSETNQGTTFSFTMPLKPKQY
jgi:signal transduction histidine kinase